MKDYSDGKHKKYGIVEYMDGYAIVEVRARDKSDKSEIIDIKPGTVSLSKNIPWLQRQIREIVDREESPLATGLQRWQEAQEKRERKERQKVGAK